MQHCWSTTPNIVGCYILRPFAHPVACCWMLFRVVAQSLKPVKLFSQQLPTFLLFRDRRSVAQQCWIRLHSSSNIVGATYAHYAWITKTYGLYSSHDALQVPNLLGVVAPFAHHCQHARHNSHCWRNNVGSCCARSHATLEWEGNSKTLLSNNILQASLISSAEHISFTENDLRCVHLQQVR